MTKVTKLNSSDGTLTMLQLVCYNCLFAFIKPSMTSSVNVHR